MKQIAIVIIIWFIFMLYWFTSEIPQNRAEYSVIDWDTIKVNWETIRILWCDAPESTTLRYWYIESGWHEAKEYLKQLLSWEDIQITRWKKDKYGRTLAYVETRLGDVCDVMINYWFSKYIKPF